MLVYDCETGDEREVTVTAKVLARFGEAYASYLADDRALLRDPPGALHRGRRERRRSTSSSCASSGAAGSSGSAVILAGLPLAHARGHLRRRRRRRSSALYILKLRRRVVAVPFSPLWERILRDKEATSLFSKLKRLLSLLLQLALLALLVLALGDPRAAESAHQGAHHRRARRRERVDAGDRRVADPARRSRRTR